MNLPNTLDGPQWLDLLERLALELGQEGSPLRLCLIGSAACIFAGMEARTSRDLDVWRVMSDYDRAELRQAAEAVGLLFDPKSTLDPDRPYLQIVEQGIVELGEFTPVLIERLGRLHLLRPPVENLIASKLLRADPRDIADVIFLQSHYQAEIAKVRTIIATFPTEKRRVAEENLLYLDLLQP